MRQPFYLCCGFGPGRPNQPNLLKPRGKGQKLAGKVKGGEREKGVVKERCVRLWEIRSGE